MPCFEFCLFVCNPVLLGFFPTWLTLRSNVFQLSVKLLLVVRSPTCSFPHLLVITLTCPSTLTCVRLQCLPVPLSCFLRPFCYGRVPLSSLLSRLLLLWRLRTFPLPLLFQTSLCSSTFAGSFSVSPLCLYPPLALRPLLFAHAWCSLHCFPSYFCFSCCSFSLRVLCVCLSLLHTSLDSYSPSIICSGCSATCVLACLPLLVVWFSQFVAHVVPSPSCLHYVNFAVLLCLTLWFFLFVPCSPSFLPVILLVLRFPSSPFVLLRLVLLLLLLLLLFFCFFALFSTSLLSLSTSLFSSFSSFSSSSSSSSYVCLFCCIIFCFALLLASFPVFAVMLLFQGHFGSFGSAWFPVDIVSSFNPFDCSFPRVFAKNNIQYSLWSFIIWCFSWLKSWVIHIAAANCDCLKALPGS